MKLEILTPDREIYLGEASAILFPGLDGLFAVFLQLVSPIMSVRPVNITNIFFTTASVCFLVILVSIILFLALAPIIAIFLPYDSTIKIGILIAAASFLFPALSQIIIGLLQKKLRMDKAVIAETASRLILVAGIYFSIKLEQGLNGILWVTVISAAVNFLISYLLSAKYYLLKQFA